MPSREMVRGHRLGQAGTLLLLGLSHTACLAVRSWHAEVGSWLRGEGLRWSRQASGVSRPLWLVRSSPAGAPVLAVHLLHTPRSRAEVLPPDATASVADDWERGADGVPLVHLWEDEWRCRNPIVRSRLLAMAGRSRRHFARKLVVRRIDAATLEAFLLEHHLWGPTQARFRYGLFLASRREDGAAGREGEEELVAVASFSARRNVERSGVRYRSHELIRYCSRRGESVVGGISKLIAAFRREMAPDDIVTVVDRNWGAGDGWRSLGFEPVQRMPPATFFVGPDGARCHAMGGGRNPHRRQLPESILADFAAADAVESSAATDCAATASTAAGAPPPASRLSALAEFAAERRYFSVHDAGARRLLLLLRAPPTPAEEAAPSPASPAHAGPSPTMTAWLESTPRYPDAYYLPSAASASDEGKSLGE